LTPQGSDLNHSTAQLPRRGTIVSRWLGRSFLQFSGWSINGHFPDVRKLIVVVAPHTSNWDFVFGIAAVFALGLKVNWMGKNSLFKGGLGPIMRWLGGIPVDRSKPNGVVGQLVDEFSRREQLLLGITPEGTRSRVDRWKTGFYHLAIQARVPLVPAYMDYRLKQLVILDPLPVTGAIDNDLVVLREVFASVTPKRPENYNPEFC
jgi:1-acyl-sn-glycerol-3-phosphate acyltransferase